MADIYLFMTTEFFFLQYNLDKFVFHNNTLLLLLFLFLGKITSI